MSYSQTAKTLPSFLRFLFSPFFRNWWAVLTGCASILAMYITPSQGIKLSGAAMMTATFVALSLIFVTLSVLGQGWQLYLGRLGGLQVSSFERNRDMPEGWLFVLVGDVDLAVGTVIDIHKKTGAAEVPLSLVRIASRNSCGAYQAAPIGKINPTHIKEHSAGGLRPADLIVRTSVDLQRIKEAANDLG
ncbi:MAG: hypothetical protein ACWGKN_09395 [Desulfoprunum sp.]|jgi:hypothetical protein